MQIHHRFRQRIEEAIIEATGGFEDTATGRMIVGNLDDIAMVVAEKMHDIELRCQEAEDERVIGEFARELETWTGS